MPVEFPCAGCGRMLRTPDASRGKKARCPQCGAISDVPEEAPPAPAERGSPFGEPAAEGGAASPFAAPPAARPGDEDNPYAPPPPVMEEAAVREGALAAGEPVHRRVSAGEMLNATFQAISAHFASLIIFALVVFGISLGVNIVSRAVGFLGALSQDMALTILGQVFAAVLGMAVQVWLNIGTANYMTKLLRTGQGQLNHVFNILHVLVRGVLVMLVIGAVALGLALVCLAPAGLAVLIAGQNAAIALLIGGVAAAAIAVLVWVMRTYVAIYFVVDRGAEVLEAISLSGQFMRQNKLSAFLASFVVSVASLLFACVTCGLGLLMINAFFGLFGAVVYMRVTGQPLAGVSG